MQVGVAHYRERGISFAVFGVDARSQTDADRQTLLNQLAMKARRNGLRVDKAALAFRECGQTRLFGAPDLVTFLSSRGQLPRPTHTLEV